MKRDGLIKKIMTCHDTALCSLCKYYTSCDGIDGLLEDILEYFEGELNAEDENSKRLIERIKKCRKG